MTTGRVIKRNGKWAYVVSLPFDPEKGRYPQKWKSGFRTRKEAQEALNDFLQELQKGTLPAPKWTLESYLEDWLEKDVVGKKARKTEETYLNNVRWYITPRIGSVLLQDLNPEDIEAFYRDLAKTLQPGTVQLARGVLRVALHRAVRRGLISSNPMKRADPPPPNRARRRDPLTVEQSKRVLEWLRIHHPSSHLAAFLALHTGMRRGEICGLRWKDIDWQARVLRVVQTRQRSGTEDWVERPKTTGSVRPIPVSTSVLEELAAWKDRHSSQPDDYVLQNRNGQPINPNTPLKDLHRALSALHLPKSSFHDLRHAHATFLLEAGVPLKVVSERLGHSSILLTANVYSHVSETMQQDAVERLERIFDDKKKL